MFAQKSNNLLIYSGCFIIITLLFAFFFSKSPRNSDSYSVKIGVIDGYRIQNESEVFSLAHNFAEKQQEGLNDELKDNRVRIKKLYEKVKDESIPLKERSKLKKQAEKELIELLEIDAEKQKISSEFCRENEQFLSKTIVDVSNELAQKYNLSLVFNSNDEMINIFYFNSSIDLTDEAIKMIDCEAKSNFLKNLESRSKKIKAMCVKKKK